jgi:seryl-tRNA synthetase
MNRTSDIQEYRELTRKREKLEAEFQRLRGREEELLKQLKGYKVKNVEDAQEWIEEVSKKIQSRKRKIEKLESEAKQLIRQIEGVLR